MQEANGKGGEGEGGKSMFRLDFTFKDESGAEAPATLATAEPFTTKKEKERRRHGLIGES
jgi:hypothetical protein